MKVELEQGDFETTEKTENNEKTVIDWLGRTRTLEEIKERDEFRRYLMILILSIVYIGSLITFLLLTIIYSTSIYKNTTIFIPMAVISCLLWSPIIIGFLGFIGYCIYTCCCKLL
jgi:hypothetical protein